MDTPVNGRRSGSELVFRDRGTMLRYAGYTLSVWGEQMRGREEGIPFVGNMAAGQYRPGDDPHPNTFAIVQVEITLRELKAIHTVFAWHHWILRRWHQEFNHPDLRSDISRASAIARVRFEIVGTLADQLNTIDQRELTITEATMIEMRLRSMGDSRARSLRWDTAFRERKESA